jgi:hypothetical protein
MKIMSIVMIIMNLNLLTNNISIIIQSSIAQNCLNAPLTEHIRYYTVLRPTSEIKRILSIDESVQEL